MVACPFCATLNRVDLTRIADRPRCGSCGRPILLDRPLAVTDATLDAVLKGTEVPVVLDGYADWCGPCKIMAPVLDDFARDRQGEVLVVKLDTGRTQSAIWMGLTFGGGLIWYLYDIVVVAAGDFRDGDGRRVARWEVSDAAIGSRASEHRVSDLEDRMRGLESQVGELAERLDF